MKDKIIGSKYAATLMVDASWCPETFVAGYGFWIASQRGKMPGGGPIPGKVESSNLAEMQAMCIVLHIAKELRYVLATENVLIQTDCVAAIVAFSGGRQTIGRELETTLEFLRLSANVHVTLRHVKGHSLRDENRYKANNACDERAKAAMRYARRLERDKQNAHIRHTA